MGKKKRQLIVQTAINLFYEKGYAGSSIRDIGSRAGINNSIIYYYFKNKEELLFEIIRIASYDLTQTLLEIESRVLNPVECLREMLTANMLKFNIKRKKEIEIIAFDRYWLQGEQREIVRKMQREIWEIYLRNLKKIAKMRLLNNISLVIGNFCIGSIIVAFHGWYREGRGMSRKEAAQNILKFIFNGIMKKDNARLSRMKKYEFKGEADRF